MKMASSSDVAAAAARLAGIANRTPVVTSRSLDRLLDGRVFLKCENFQRVGAFKFRGAYNAISQLTPDEKAAGVITHSSGNHAQAVALASRLLGVRSVVVMPEDAPVIKRQATADYGAEIVTCPAIERESVTRHLVDSRGLTLVHPYDNADVIAGQGTAAWELLEEVSQLDLLLVPVGGGGLISGTALAAAAVFPSCRVIGCEPEGAADAGQSWRRGQVVTLDYVPDTMADGLRTRFVGERNLAIMREHVSDMVSVSEAEIVEALRFLWQRLKLVVEPSAAVALAPLLARRVEAREKRVGVILSGGNADIERIGQLLAVPSPKSTRGPSPSSPTAGRPNRPRILVCTALPEPALAALEEAGEVDHLVNLGDEELQAIIGDYHALMIGPETRLSGQTIEYGFRLRVIASTDSSADQIDVSAARSLGIDVHYIPDSKAVSVAEYTVELLLQLSRGGQGETDHEARHSLAGKTLGLIGFGRIGRQVARRALAFDMRVLVNQPRLTPELALEGRISSVDLSDLLRQSDYISLHVPFGTETRAILGRQELARLKPGAYLINTAHTDLLSDEAVLEALNDGRLAGAALAAFRPADPGAQERPAPALLEHPKVVKARHISSFERRKQPEAVSQVIRRAIASLGEQRPTESLSLAVVPVAQVAPHEAIDEKRVARLMARLETDGRLVNPPVVTRWLNKFVILDGATRYTALERLGYPHAVVQVVSAEDGNFSLHTWYHVISGVGDRKALFADLGQIDGLELRPLEASEARSAFNSPGSLCYFVARDRTMTLATAASGARQLDIMNEMVARYTAWGKVERTLLTDIGGLAGQFPDLVAVAVYPQFAAETVFDLAAQGKRLPAGLTRFVIPGRILRLNADLERLKRDEPLALKRAWLDRLVQGKLARSRMRYYQEPVILLDE